MSVKKLAIGAVVVVVVGAGIAANLRWQRTPAVKVQVEEVGRRKLTAIVSGSGMIRPYKEVDVSSNVMGRVTNLAVIEGQEVVTGDLLLRIDPVPYRSAVDQMQARIASAETQLDLARENLRFARQTLDRREGLYQQDLASRESYDQALQEEAAREREVRVREQDLEQLRAQLVSVEHDLTKVTLISPIDGVITKLSIEEGETVITGTMNNPGTVLMTIADLSVVEAEIEIDETDIVHVELGQDAEVRVDAFPDDVFGAVVTEVGKSPINAQAASTGQAINFKVVVRVTESVAGARPGLSCTADLTTAVREGVLAVPIQALLLREISDETDEEAAEEGAELADAAPEGATDGEVIAPAGNEVAAPALEDDDGEPREREGAFVMRDGRAVFVPIEIGIAGERHFEVLSGVAEGDQVIIGPFDRLRDLQEEDLVEAEESPGRARAGRSGDR